jgi:16S rRNA (uracil1498-N3)-methyltransferase
MRPPRARLLVGALPGGGETAALSPEEAAHARARRVRPGDLVTLVDGSGREARAVIVTLAKEGGEAAVEAILETEDARLPIALFVAGLRPERLAWIAEKATELGASWLTIVETARTQSFRASGKTAERLERIVREAAKQCEAARWPEIRGPISFDAALSDDRSRARFLLDSSGESFPDELASGSVALLVGPEGGWNTRERQAARASGWKLIALPAGKLRAETAAIAALVLARAALDRGRR